MVLPVRNWPGVEDTTLKAACFSLLILCPEIGFSGNAEEVLFSSRSFSLDFTLSECRFVALPYIFTGWPAWSSEWPCFQPGSNTVGLRLRAGAVPHARLRSWGS